MTTTDIEQCQSVRFAARCWLPAGHAGEHRAGIQTWSTVPTDTRAALVASSLEERMQGRISQIASAARVFGDEHINSVPDVWSLSLAWLLEAVDEYRVLAAPPVSADTRAALVERIWKLEDALAKRILADWNRTNRERGVPNNWPAQQEWDDLAPSSRATLRITARREAGISLDDPHLAPPVSASEPEGWLAEVFFNGAWGAPTLHRRRIDAQEHLDGEYDESVHPVRISPLYRTPACPAAGEEGRERESALVSLVLLMDDALREGDDHDAVWQDVVKCARAMNAPGHTDLMVTPESLDEYFASPAAGSAEPSKIRLDALEEAARVCDDAARDIEATPQFFADDAYMIGAFNEALSRAAAIRSLAHATEESAEGDCDYVLEAARKQIEKDIRRMFPLIPWERPLLLPWGDPPGAPLDQSTFGDMGV
jgi:hypothetical protein